MGRVSISPHLLVQKLPDGESVLLNVQTEEYFGLDGVGSRIWDLLSAGEPPDAVRRLLFEEYVVDGDQLAADLSEFLGQLLDHGLIEVDDQ